MNAVPESEALAVSETERMPKGALVAAPADYTLANLSEPQFQALLDAMRIHTERVKKIQREQMVYGTHYGVPGMTNDQWLKAQPPRAPSIYKAGVELLMKLMRLVPEVSYTVDYGDVSNALSPAWTVNAICRVHRDSVEGPTVAVGVGACNAWETKYRWRQGKLRCPDCQSDALQFMREAKYGPYKGQPSYWCPPDKGGCNGNFSNMDERLTGQDRGRVPNDAVMDLLNTGIKIGCKRARSDGAVLAAQASDLFTTDLEDLAENGVEIGSRKAPTPLPNPPPAKPAAPPAPPPKKADPDPASQAQLGKIRALATERLGPGDPTALVEAKFHVALSLLDKASASKLIQMLLSEPHYMPTRAESATATPNKFRAQFMLEANRCAALPSDAARNIVENDVGDWLMDTECLALLGVKDPVMLDDIKPEEFMRLTTHLRAYIAQHTPKG